MSDVRSRRSTVIGSTMLTIAALALLAPAAANAQDWQTASYSREAAGEDLLRVSVEYGAGEFRIGAAERGSLYRANLRWDANAMTPTVTFRENHLRFGIEGSGRGKHISGKHVKGGRLDLRLATDVPLDLALQFGAADATLDLGGLSIRKAEIQTGASRTMLNVSSPNRETCESVEIRVGAAQFEARGLGNLNARSLTLEGGVGEVILDFTGEWSTDMSASVEMGLGSLTLRVPMNLGVHVVRTGVLSSFDSEGLTKRGNVYTSQDWDNAEHKLSLDLESALGAVRVVWVDPQS